VGGLAGFVTWLALLEGPGMGNVLYRVGEDGKKKFVSDNLVAYLSAPFKHDYFWNENFLQHNWIVMCGGGIVTGCLASVFPLN
jgi:hypothetical protein